MDLVSEKLSEGEKSVTASEVKETKSPKRIFNDLIWQSVQEIPEGEIENPAKLRHNKICQNQSRKYQRRSKYELYYTIIRFWM